MYLSFLFSFFPLAARPPHSKEEKKRGGWPGAAALLFLATPQAAHREEWHNRDIEKPCPDFPFLLTIHTKRHIIPVNPSN